MSQERKGEFKLHIPLDASRIEDFDPKRPVKVVVQDNGGTTYSNTVQFDEKGKGAVEFAFSEQPDALRVMVGPPDASDEEMAGLQTIGFNISANQWLKKRELRLEPVQIAPYYWHWWLIWCRYFTIRGRVLCPDGSPVPNAKVCAYDVDWCWWWGSIQQVGCDITDATGAFEIKFRWCCGWWPWWWWRHRFWYLEPALVDRIIPLLERLPELKKIPTPSPKPDLAVFEELLGEKFAELNIPSLKIRTIPTMLEDSKAVKSLSIQTQQSQLSIDPGVLPELQTHLVEALPASLELKQLCIWPWCHWYPWRDCYPDIIFKVTQECLGEERIIVNEGFGDVRWNIPTLYNEILYANSNACCIDPDPDPPGNCVNITHACLSPVSTIGGNLSASPTPEGYQDPGIITPNGYGGDRPFANTIKIRGNFGTLSTAHYYEFEWFNPDPAVSDWEPLPPTTISGFNRLYFGPQLPGPGGPIGTWPAPFPVEIIDGHNVIKTRRYFEALNGPGTWEVLGVGGRWWMDNKDMLIYWHTQNNFANGTYKLRVKSWQLIGGHLVNPKVLPQCGTASTDNSLIITTDNRVETSGPTDIHGRPCGPGTVHRCTNEPDTCFLDVKICHSDGTSSNVNACQEYSINDTDILQVDFIAHDPAGHLSYFTLNATYGVNLKRILLDLPAVDPVGPLTSSPLSVPGVPSAAQVGPTYGDALTDTPPAVSPHWYGGVMRLRVKAKDAFPDTCCYQLELRAHKRTIVNCTYHYWGHINYSEYSFMIKV